MSNRRLRRFFTSDPIEKMGDEVSLTPSDTEHLRRILRLKAGDLCLVTNGKGREAEARVLEDAGPHARLSVQKMIPAAISKGICLFVYPAFIQRGKMDDLIRPMQELGVQGFFPLETERTIVKMDENSKIKVLQRWEKAVQEAAKQSGSLQMLSCDVPRPLQEILGRIPEEDMIAVFHPGSKSLGFQKWIQKVSAQSRVHLFFGPEGGFSEKEVGWLESRGAVRVEIGETVLKADTAVLGTAAALKFLYT